MRKLTLLAAGLTKGTMQSGAVAGAALGLEVSGEWTHPEQVINPALFLLQVQALVAL